MDRRQVLAAGVAMGALPGLSWAQALEPAWIKLPTEPYRGKQDDVVFVDALTGWYGNGAGKLFKTTDGGRSWTQILDRPGTFVRALGFVDTDLGFLGNIGPDYFPGVTDATPLYRTRDGGASWEAVTIDGPAVTGICAIDVHKASFINAGVLGHRVTIRAGGRVGGPALLATSRDGGETWTSEDLSALTAMILDVHFVDERIGFICGASDTNVEQSRAVILRTGDGGRTWARVYEGSRPFELTWKMAFPTESTGYVTVQSYNPDTTVSQRVFAKTTDGGLTWSELPLIDNAAVREFGIGFVDENRGWIGAVPNGFETRDGGATWAPVAMGLAVNKVRVVPNGAGVAVFGIGVELHRLDLPG
ncbi:hypothetical protein [Brevundimonas sp.]|uniref:WD40/YVTN/BNR-like repeat-containing protein n=1 Tax=Brevundimonas sp. TaxID=1871086 RepID=UPI00262F9F07|nr:hypothetical protein [Brevundimonas sp.]